MIDGGGAKLFGLSVWMFGCQDRLAVERSRGHESLKVLPVQFGASQEVCHGGSRGCGQPLAHPRCDKTHKGLVSILSDTVFPEGEGCGISWHAFVSTLFAGKTFFFFFLFSFFFLRNSRLAFTGTSRSKPSRLSVLFDLVIATKPNKYLLRTDYQ